MGGAYGAGVAGVCAGARLADRFVVKRPLGGGGMGVVFEAVDEERGELVALKTLERLEARAVYGLKREFRALADLAHPNLVRLFELFSDDGRWFFTMQKVDGVSFLEHVRGDAQLAVADTLRSAKPTTDPALTATEPTVGGALREPELRAALQQLVDAVRAIHRAGKLHRDLKPSNVLVADGRVTLLDFGLVQSARHEIDKSLDLAAAGTPAYMAPEQLSPNGACAASDWYALGVMLYEGLTGTLPYGGTMHEVLDQKRSGKPPPHPHTLSPGAPDDLAALAMALLTLEPNERPSEAAIVEVVGAPAEALEVAPPSSDEATVFVGRDEELARLHAAYEMSREGVPVLVCVEGVSGIGKSALVARFLDDIRGEPVALTGRCYERESVPFKALDAVVDALSRHLGSVGRVAAAKLTPRYVGELCRAFPVLGRVPAFADEAPGTAEPQEVRRRAFVALKELFARMAARRPVVVAIDDLQWGDVDSGAFLRHLLDPPEPPPVLWIVSYRSDEVERSALLQALVVEERRSKHVRSERLVLEPLAAVEAQALARELLERAPEGAPKSDRARAIAEEARGSPFFIGELARWAKDKRGERRASVVELIEARVSALPQEARALLEVVAIAGQPLPLAVALTTARVEGDAAVPVLRAASLLRATGEGGVETYHDRIRDTVMASLDEAAQRARHRALAEALEAHRGASADMLAHHWREAGERDKALHYARAAADRAAELLAFDRAARFYRAALELAPTEDASGLRMALARALANAGRGKDAAEAYVAAAERMERRAALPIQALAADQYLRAGYLDEGLSLIEPVLRAVGLRAPKTISAVALGILMQRVRLRVRGHGFRKRREADVPAEDLLRTDTCISMASVLATVDSARGAYFGTLGLALALKIGEPNRLAITLASQACFYAAEGKVERARGFIARASEAGKNPKAEVLSALADCVAAYMTGNWAQALERGDFCARLGRQTGGVAYEVDIAGYLLMAALNHRGAFDELQRRGLSFLHDAQARGDLYAETMFRTTFAPRILLAADDPELAGREADAALARWPAAARHLQHYLALQSSVLASIYAGECRAAWERGMLEWARYRRSLLRRVQAVRIEVLHMEAFTAIAAASDGLEPQALLGRAERATRKLEREPLPWPRAWAELDRAGIACVRGELEGAVARFGVAASALEAADMRAYAAAAHRRRGELLAGDEGAAIVLDADERLRALGVKSPERMAAMLAPGRRPT